MERQKYLGVICLLLVASDASLLQAEEGSPGMGSLSERINALETSVVTQPVKLQFEEYLAGMISDIDRVAKEYPSSTARLALAWLAYDYAVSNGRIQALFQHIKATLRQTVESIFAGNNPKKTGVTNEFVEQHLLEYLIRARTRLAVHDIVELNMVHYYRTEAIMTEYKPLSEGGHDGWNVFNTWTKKISTKYLPLGRIYDFVEDCRHKLASCWMIHWQLTETGSFSGTADNLNEVMNKLVPLVELNVTSDSLKKLMDDYLSEKVKQEMKELRARLEMDISAGSILRGIEYDFHDLFDSRVHRYINVAEPDKDISQKKHKSLFRFCRNGCFSAPDAIQ